jgi:hypothetical protein
LNEGADVGVLGGFPYVSVTLFCRIAKKKKVIHLGGGLPMPLSWVPGKPINETGFENLE